MKDSRMQQETLHAVASAADKTTAGGIGLWAVGGLTSTDIAAYGGLIIAFLGLIVAGVFKVLEFRELRRHNKTIEAKRWSDE
jgi:ABC-type proline/glycine betaine transport system permease subunit